MVVMVVAHALNFDELASLSDPATYHRYAIILASRFSEGVFVVHDIYEWHWYPIALGVWYAISTPSMVAGKILSVLLSAISSFLLYRLMRALGGTPRASFWCALIAVNVYPAFLLFGSTLVKEVFLVPLVLAALLACVRILKQFEPVLFFVFAALLTLIITLRFMVGEVLLVAFLISWLFAAPFPLRTRLVSGSIFVFLFGAQILALGFGLLGMGLASDIGRPEYIEEYRIIAYAREKTVSTGSTTNIGIFEEGVFRATGFLYSLATVTLGPFIWQAKKITHGVAIIEGILWIGVLVPIVASFFGRFPSRSALPVILFSGGWLLVVALGSDNIGATMRYRMPAFLALASLAPLGFVVLQSNYARFIHHHKI
jgi:hypothetical protein